MLSAISFVRRAGHLPLPPRAFASSSARVVVVVVVVVVASAPSLPSAGDAVPDRGLPGSCPLLESCFRSLSSARFGNSDSAVSGCAQHGHAWARARCSTMHA
eukprot:30998-Pelagococcus_subviridis.AAC.5